MKVAVIAAALLLSACASGPSVVRVPVPVPCHTGELPVEPEQVGPRLSGNAERDVGIIAASALRLRAYSRELRALLDACR
jgi:hypothetical protein